MNLRTNMVWLGGIIAMLALTSAAQAAVFDRLLPEKSKVSFVFTQMKVPIEGQFKRFNGKLQFDPARLAATSVSIDLELASIDTGSEEADDEVAGKLWFDTKQFPLAHFDLTSIKVAGTGRYAVQGKLRIKGHTHDVVAQAVFTQQGNTGVFEGGFVLRRADFGIGEGMWADFGTVANDVQVKFRLVATGK